GHVHAPPYQRPEQPRAPARHAGAGRPAAPRAPAQAPGQGIQARRENRTPPAPRLEDLCRGHRAAAAVPGGAVMATLRRVSGGLAPAGGTGSRISAMRVRLAIGDFSRMTHLSVKALRHYHDVGLLVPAEIDPASGYRFYEPGQVPLAQVIRRFRDLGMPLNEIREVLQASDVGARNRVIVAHMQRMESQLAVTQSVVASLRSLLERPPAPVPIEHRSGGPERALAISEQVAAPDLDGWWDAAFRELDAALAAAAVRAAGPRTALYSAAFFELDEGEVVAYVPVTNEVG